MDAYIDDKYCPTCFLCGFVISLWQIYSIVLLEFIITLMDREEHISKIFVNWHYHLQFFMISSRIKQP